MATVSILNPILDKIRASRERARVQVVYPGRCRTLRLRQYQHEDVAWLRETKRGIIAAAPGLGKTLVSTEAAELPALVTCPVALVEQWRAHLEEQYPSDRVVVAAYGNFMQRAKALEKPFDWLIVGHDMFRRFAMPRSANTLIVDEYHHFRNREAARSKNLAIFGSLTPRVYGLTATPVYKDVGDLWHQLHILDTQKWGTYSNFIYQYAVTLDRGWGASVVRTRNEAKLKAEIKPYVRERTYKEVGMFLPERIDKHVLLKLDPIFKKTVYDKLRDFYRLEIEGQDEATRFTNAGAVLHQLRKILVTDEKLAAVKSLVDDTPSNEPVIVFVWYKDTAAKVAETLDGVEITGELAPAARRELALTGGPNKKRVRVATMASLAEGVDLSAARTVIFVEEAYVPGQNYQAMSRVQRFSTSDDQRPIVAYWIRYQDTVDEIVHRTARARVAGNALSVLKEALGIS